jgi:hypothetical protein
MRAIMLIHAFEVASGPWGWAYAGANVLAMGVSLSTLGQ